MKRQLSILCLIFSGTAALKAQINPNQTALPPRTPTQVSRDIDDRFRQLNDMHVKRSENELDKNTLNEKIQAIYRKPGKNETKLLAPNPQIVDLYKDFLREQNTGIVKLNADASCAGNAAILKVEENCSQYNFPGGGTAFSFRVRSYRVPHLADLKLEKDVIKTDGFLQHGLMVNLGDVPLESVSLQSAELKYLLDFKAAETKKDFPEIDKTLEKGVKSNGFIYSLGFYVKPNNTFALRSIAYRSVAMRSVNGITYDEFMFDKRKDIVVAFRVVDIDRQGNVTILWKTIQEHDAPKIVN